MLIAKSLGMSVIYTCMFNYFVVIFVVSSMGTELFHEFSPEKNAMFLYAILFPVTFIVATYFTVRNMRKEMEKEMSKKEYHTVTHKDSDGNMYVELPSALLNQMGWATGDTLEWADNNDGTFTITKKEEDED